MKTLNFLTVEEIATVLRVDEASVRRWLRDGQLQGVKVGRAWRVDEMALQAFLEKHSASMPTSWFIAEPEALDLLTGLGRSEQAGDARDDFRAYWTDAFKS